MEISNQEQNSSTSLRCSTQCTHRFMLHQANGARDYCFFPQLGQKFEFGGRQAPQCEQAIEETSFRSSLLSTASTNPFPKLFATFQVFLMPFPISSPVFSATFSILTGFSSFFCFPSLNEHLSKYQVNVFRAYL